MIYKWTFHSAESNEEFRSEVLHFLEEALPVGWNVLDVEGPYSQSNIQFTKPMAKTLVKRDGPPWCGPRSMVAKADLSWSRLLGKRN